MSRRNKKRLNSGTCSQAKSYFFFLIIPEKGVRSSLLTRKDKRKKWFLGATYSGNIQSNSHIRSQSHFSGMSNPVSINQSNIRFIIYFLKLLIWLSTVFIFMHNLHEIHRLLIECQGVRCCTLYPGLSKDNVSHSLVHRL